MINLKAGIDTFLHWRAYDRVAGRFGQSVDRGAQLSDLCAQREDAVTLVNRLRHDGVVVVPGYWPTDICAACCSEIDKLIRSYPESVQRYSGGSDKRMFGAEAVSSLIRKFHEDSFPRKVGEILGGYELYNFATLSARIDASSENNGSGDGWHRDGHGFQFKSIVYLSDVSEDNGPFEYLIGSHKNWRAALDSAWGGLQPAPATRYEVAAIERMNSLYGRTQKSFPASAGTLVLSATAGIHRGRPLRAGTRYALTNYYYNSFQIDEGRIKQFSPLIPGAANRIRSDLSLG